ncbi:MAG: hypothetical protein HY537_02905 [Deltaproteobacteria bacterium]|nr:hypothetical protein [Deltaproteobacteria bacterium]
MKTLLIVMFLLTAVVGFGSTVKDLGPDTVEFANVVSHCLPEFRDAARNATYISKIKYLSPRPINPRVLTEIWTVSMIAGGFMPGPPPREVARLVVTRVTDSSGPVVPDKPAKVTYACEVIEL